MSVVRWTASLLHRVSSRRMPIRVLICLLVSSAMVHGFSSSGSSNNNNNNKLDGTGTTTAVPISSRRRIISVADAIQTFDTLTFIDASWYHKGERNGYAEYLRGPRIANAVYFDLSSSGSTSTSTRRCQQPTAKQFASIMDGLGITNDSNIVIYGQPGAFFLPRAWFTIRHVMGHESCWLLNGTLADWEAAGGTMDYHTLATNHVTNIRTPIIPKTTSTTTLYQPRYNPNVLIGLDDMKTFVQDRTAVILDARGSSFRHGHMPGAIHIPYSSLQDEHGRLKSSEQLASILLMPKLLLLMDPTVVVNNNDIVTTCGSGVSACTLFLALQEIGYLGRIRVYDGSWSEWKTHDDLPKVMPDTT